jgi:hypothetical protein
MYSPHAAAQRHCRALTAAGARCKAWALWASAEEGLCLVHSGGHHRGPMSKLSAYRRVHARYRSCSCSAYPFPHRPAGGRCRWPLTLDGSPGVARH